ncbi:pimeloyl-ACP methyl ester carboxylesterase [Actinoplanes octamycinicus]|uniref:Pimeloyl-ACP methyl ester carboxylesterase n=1 Tax=Actinoplanes octamycinicus TaxID=135948 RepID=A0A7W7M6I4_9ACTN|nr:alpha/beta hydrolase [Actinoplanes octamycinicus]MBB4738765.1 pimeloyl-ACP methyl ester carboxylesterase [Actinoplanes octamycinicus]GIE61498.1 alpha/beta hydrolase [Actinoplanes octamycinicus]
MRGAVLAGDTAVLPEGEVPPPWPARRVRVGGAMLHVRDTPALRPDAEPAVYVHGLGGSSQNFTDLAGLLADRFDGQAVDLPGFGYSDPSPRYSIPAFAATLIDYLEESGRGPVHLIGNSLGGSISVRVAALRPDLVRTLTLVSPAMPFLDPRRTAQGPVLPLLALPGAERLMAWALTRITAEQMAEQVLAACFGDTTKVHPQRRAEAMEEIQLRYTVAHYPRAYLGTLRGLVGSFLRAYLPGVNSQWRLAARVQAPTLVIGGLNDKLVDPRVPVQVAKAIPDSRLLILPGVGHVAQMEVPRLVARAIAGMLDEAA